jgi:hypothetical protein
MGASGWHYFTPYRPDVAEALEPLRRDVFARGEYGHTMSKPIVYPPEYLASLSPAERQRTEAFLKEMGELRRQWMELQAAKGLPEPRTIEEALDQAAELGTHSILDIFNGISAGRDFATAFPMPEQVMFERYGTTRPSRAQVEAARRRMTGDGLGRWECHYAVVYEDGRPSELYFEGCSGD